MNRTIKFRVWDKKRNKFVKEAFTGGFDSAEIKITLNGKLTWECEYGDGIVDGIVQQFTGLLDKNNKEIYEGDIIKDTWKVNYPYGYRPDEFIDDQSIFEVKYFAPSFNLDIKRSGDQTCIEDFVREVIGNIFETPELLISDNTIETIESSIKNIKDSNPIDLSVHKS